MADFILVLGDREAVGWVLSEQRMAFPRNGGVVGSLRKNDRVLIHTTRGCFRNPTRDRGRIVAAATVTSPVAALLEPAHFAGREFPFGCTLHIPAAAPFRSGPSLTDMVEEVAALNHGARGWATRMRRTLVPLPLASDYRVLRSALRRVEQPLDTVIEPYLQWWAQAQERTPVPAR